MISVCLFLHLYSCLSSHRYRGMLQSLRVILFYCISVIWHFLLVLCFKKSSWCVSAYVKIYHLESERSQMLYITNIWKYEILHTVPTCAYCSSYGFGFLHCYCYCYSAANFQILDVRGFLNVAKIRIFHQIFNSPILQLYFHATIKKAAFYYLVHSTFQDTVSGFLVLMHSQFCA